MFSVIKKDTILYIARKVIDIDMFFTDLYKSSPDFNNPEKAKYKKQFKSNRKWIKFWRQNKSNMHVKNS